MTKINNHKQRMNDAAAIRTVSEENKVEGTWMEPHEFDLENDDLHTTENVEITHPTSNKGPHLIEEDQPIIRVTRSSRRLKLLTAVDISGSCPTARQAASRKFPLAFLTDFAGSVLDAETG